MASENHFSDRIFRFGWLAGLILTAWGGGWCFAMGFHWWCAFMVAAAVFCGAMLVRVLLRVEHRLGYVIDATANGDFSYKFPTEKVSRPERETNEMFNRIVEHLEHLASDIRQKESFLTHVINMTDVGMAVADEAGNIVMHNDSVLRLLERPALTHVCQFSSQQSQALSITKTRTSLNGKTVFIYTFKDLRHPVQSAEVESWEKLTRVLTHEIMNSLTPIHSIADNMKGNAQTTEVKEAFETISSSTDSLMRFVKNFRKFSVLPELHMRTVYLRPLLEKCVQIGKTYDEQGDVKFRLTCFPPDIMLYTDESLLNRVIINILKNAVEASAAHISVEASVAPDDSVEIRIANDGEQIADENAEQIFTPFFTTRAGGSGIGLSLSRRIVNHLGGTLTLTRLPRTAFSIRI